MLGGGAGEGKFLGPGVDCAGSIGSNGGCCCVGDTLGIVGPDEVVPGFSVSTICWSWSLFWLTLGPVVRSLGISIVCGALIGDAGLFADGPFATTSFSSFAGSSVMSTSGTR